MATKDNNPMGVFNLETRSEEQILSDLAKQQRAGTFALEQARPQNYQGERDIRTAGGQLGALLRNRYQPPQLTPQQQMEQQATKTANQLVSQRYLSGQHYLKPDGSFDKAALTRDRLREKAVQMAQMGDPRGDQMVMEMDRLELTRRKDERAFANAELEGQAKMDALEEAKYDRGRRVVNEMLEVWPQDSLDPNDRHMLYIDANGDAKNPNTGEVVFPAGKWASSAPVTPEMMKADGPGAKDLLPSDKDRGQFLRRGRDIEQSMQIGIDIGRAMKSAINEDGSLNIMGWGGKSTLAMTGLIDNLVSMAKGAGDTLMITDEAGNQKTSVRAGTLQGWSQKYAMDNQRVFAGIPLPDSLDRTDPRAVQQYQGLIVQYAYAKARMNEENGRISDVDFDNAIRQIAGSATDPEAFRRVMTGDIDRAASDWLGWYEDYHKTVRPYMISDEGLKSFEDKYNEWNRIYGQDFGTPSQATIDVDPNARNQPNFDKIVRGVEPLKELSEEDQALINDILSR